MLYVGGLDEQVTAELLRAAFIPFGDLKDAQLPLDMHTQVNKGFGFVEFESEEDAAAAIANMDGAELFGRVLKVNAAKPNAGGKGKAVWAEAADWYENLKDQLAAGEAGEGEEGSGGGAGKQQGSGPARPPAAQK
jgi:peptidyl-prolyl isomerase E (cyclophilin E)